MNKTISVETTPSGGCDAEWAVYLRRYAAYLAELERALRSGRPPRAAAEPPLPGGPIPEQLAGELLFLVAEAARIIDGTAPAPTGFAGAAQALSNWARTRRRPHAVGAAN